MRFEPTSRLNLKTPSVQTWLRTRLRAKHSGTPLELAVRTSFEKELEWKPVKLLRNTSVELNWNSNWNRHLCNTLHCAFQRPIQIRNSQARTEDLKNDLLLKFVSFLLLFHSQLSYSFNLIVINLFNHFLGCYIYWTIKWAGSMCQPYTRLSSVGAPSGPLWCVLEICLQPSCWGDQCKCQLLNLRHLSFAPRRALLV